MTLRNSPRSCSFPLLRQSRLARPWQGPHVLLHRQGRRRQRCDHDAGVRPLHRVSCVCRTRVVWISLSADKHVSVFVGSISIVRYISRAVSCVVTMRSLGGNLAHMVTPPPAGSAPRIRFFLQGNAQLMRDLSTVLNRRLAEHGVANSADPKPSAKCSGSATHSAQVHLTNLTYWFVEQK